VHGQFRARLTQVELDHLRLSAAEEQLPSIGFLEVPAAKLLVSFPMGDQPAPVWGGISLRKGEFMLFGPGYRGHMRTQGHCRWGAIWLHAQEMAHYFRVLTEHTLTIPPVAQRWHSPPAPRRCLLQLHAAAIRIAKARPETFLGAAAAHGLEQEVIEALVECLSAGRAVEEAPATHRHQEIMLRFEDLLGTQPSRHMGVDEFSAATGVSVRVLQMCCKKVLGMSPTSYVRLRALYRVRHILRAQNPDATSVAQVARSQGFRALGRFAATYRSLFGELPSSRLRRDSQR
jgi:AraC-like DNA-binding protein